ncbi:hypothetical protein SAM23877_3563 [Streptomyces ambofaciens ATCC 23877]|uniref:Uncharacterized protein n=1 Tax=Streptomyces ambofaciens (strain ATCC 23877 / 3486 / DSM 40053 / JCM 4204 / NBRC 12836 / NRRL B-2516) TaxID=278992 RepID=A0A0K2AU12_STRA7|nr:hypothetical protein SAM23877_3563 [Streptomyces ambofaciens ATCC 23877]
MEVTGTNRPRACPQLLRVTVLVPEPGTNPMCTNGAGFVQFHSVFRWVIAFSGNAR